MEHTEENLNVKCLEYLSPSWARSVFSHDQAIKWAKAKVCVYADSVLCVGQMKDSPGAMEGWKGQVEGLRLYSSYQDAVGIDGEAIEFERKNFTRFSLLSIPQEIQEDSARKNMQPEKFKDRIIFMSMLMTLIGKRMMRIIFRMPRMSRITRWTSRRDIGHFRGPGSEDKWCGSSSSAQKGTMDFTANQMVTAIQRNWSSCVQKYQCLWVVGSWSRRKVKVPYTSMEIQHLVPNNSFCKSAQYLRSSGELVSTLWPDRGREGTSQFVCGQQDVDNFTTGRSTTLGISSDIGTRKQDARKRFELRSTGQ